MEKRVQRERGWITRGHGCGIAFGQRRRLDIISALLPPFL
jgi:hypothetical protein